MNRLLMYTNIRTGAEFFQTASELAALITIDNVDVISSSPYRIYHLLGGSRLQRGRSEIQAEGINTQLSSKDQTVKWVCIES